MNENDKNTADDARPVNAESVDDGTRTQNQNPQGIEPAPRPIEELTTLSHVPGNGPTGDDGRPDGFVPGDQTAAGALTPPGGQHPGEPSGIPGEAGNLLDPYNVNGTNRNQELLDNGQGLDNPNIDRDPNCDKENDDNSDK